MWMVMPRFNSSSNKYGDISFDNFACPNCDYVIGLRKVGGNIYQSAGSENLFLVRPFTFNRA